MTVSAQSLRGPLFIALATSALFAQEKPVDACRLLNPTEIQQVQGSAPTSTRATSQNTPQLASSQCFFNLDPFPQSISLEVMQQSVEGKKTARQLWTEKFHGTKLDEHENGEERKAPRLISGVGEEAFWVNSGRDGALYTLQGRYMLRIGVGGKDGEPIMVQHASALAQFALQKLPSMNKSNP